MRTKKLVALAAIGATMLAAGCGNSADRYMGGKGPINPKRSTTIVEARKEAIALELELYNYLEKEFGIGEWTAPPSTGTPQVNKSLFLDCPSGYSSEAWVLAISPIIPKGNWDEIVKGVESILTPKGFTSPKLSVMPDGAHIALYTNPSTGARVEVGFELATVVTIDTGCVQGKQYERWPEGAESVPLHMRTSGRFITHPEGEIWPEQSPGSNQ